MHKKYIMLSLFMIIFILPNTSSKCKFGNQQFKNLYGTNVDPILNRTLILGGVSGNSDISLSFLKVPLFFGLPRCD